MVSFFPPLFPGETLYSACARYSDRSRGPRSKEVIEELFGDTTVKARIAANYRIASLVKALPRNSSYTCDYLIAHHTILPFQCFTLSAQMKSVILDAAKKAKGFAVRGHTQNNIPPNFLRYCPDCVEQDRNELGEAYWHREHQLPGIQVCSKHSVRLIETLEKPYKSAFTFFSARRWAITSERTYLDMTKPDDRLHLWLAQQANLLLTGQYSNLNHEDMRLRYSQLLADRGLASANGSTVRSIANFLATFETHFPPGFLSSLDCQFDRNKTNQWPLMIVQKGRSSAQTLKHLLFMHFLEEDLDSIVAMPEERQFPFGAGPWPCLSRQCDFHLKPIVTQYRVSYQKTYPLPSGIFKCPQCGFTYQRLGPDKCFEDRYRYDRILRPGEQWLNAFNNVSQDLSLTNAEKAKRLGISCHGFLRRLRKLGHYQKGPRVWLVAHEADQQFSGNPQLDPKNSHPKSSDAGSARKCSHDYSCFCGNDDGCPRETCGKSGPLTANEQADWTARDIAVSGQIPDAVKAILCEPGRPLPITKTAIAKRISPRVIRWFRVNFLRHLPRCSKLLDFYVETREQLAIRRVQWAQHICIEDGQLLSRYDFIHFAGVDGMMSEINVCNSVSDALARIQRHHAKPE